MTEWINRQKAFSTKWLARGSLVGAISAFVGASCCVLPLVLFNLGVSSAIISQLGFLSRFREAFLFISIGLIVAGVFFAFKSGRRPSKGAVFNFSLAVAFVIAAHSIPLLESDLLVFFGYRGQG